MVTAVQKLLKCPPAEVKDVEKEQELAIALALTFLAGRKWSRTRSKPQAGGHDAEKLGAITGEKWENVSANEPTAGSAALETDGGVFIAICFDLYVKQTREFRPLSRARRRLARETRRSSLLRYQAADLQRRPPAGRFYLRGALLPLRCTDTGNFGP
ncbi:hypothetical protein HPB48_023237 [Haemaphysalis longicornis]|uniref:Uncharacterized protein n=1 Tax=Haemaphysalis longicornis TaxID=44386 RepID=A0A9J6H6N4_HAELO|nr:hypothetical protein HPB48_023237 [Haemaphysalis longicornis]